MGSSGGGAAGLTYAWGIDEALSDNAAALEALLAALGSVPAVTLSSELNGASTFVFTLTVTNEFGVASAPSTITVLRDALPIPTITIPAAAGAEPVLIRADASTTLAGSASLASCFNGPPSSACSYACTGGA